MLRSVERFAAFRIAASERTPPAAAHSRWSTVSSLRSITSATSFTTSGDVWPIIAIRIATSAWSSASRSSITLAASGVVGSWATTMATVWGCSLRRNAAIWSGGVLRRNSNGVCSMITDRRFRISPARCVPTDCSSTSRAKRRPPSAM